MDYLWAIYQELHTHEQLRHQDIYYYCQAMRITLTPTETKTILEINQDYLEFKYERNRKSNP